MAINKDADLEQQLLSQLSGSGYSPLMFKNRDVAKTDDSSLDANLEAELNNKGGGGSFLRGSFRKAPR